MDKRANILLSIGAIWVSLVIGIFFFSLVRPGIGTRWKQEPALPDQISHLRLGGLGEILAQTPQGNVEVAYNPFFPFDEYGNLKLD